MKKILSILLCAALVCSLLPMGAFAAGGMDFAFADIAVPVAGEAPSYNASHGGTGYVPDAGNNNPNYYKNGVGWFDLTDNKNVPVDGGTFAPGHQYKVMIFFSPKEGYNFVEGVTAQINGEDAEVTLFENGTLLAELTFPRLPEEEMAINNPFKDVKESDYFYDAVLWAVETDVTTGTSATTFSPNANCTRAQVVTFLWRSAGCPEPAPMDNPFKDVDPGAYYYKAVLWAVGSKITTGTSATTFSPEASCTRAQVVTFMWRAAGQQEVSSSNPFKDVKESEYYYKAVLWAVDRGITTGLSATSFGPNATCTRAQIVTFLYRFIGASNPLTIISQPADYYMESSMETVDFVVQVAGGTAPYTFQWVICYDNEEVRPDPVTSESPIHVLSRSFSDYDFDDYRKIAVYCIITDAAGDRIETEWAEVLQKK